jgi:hypothetical protein
MDREDIARAATQRAAEVSRPLIFELAERLNLDLEAGEPSVRRMLSDFAARLYEAGYEHGSIEKTAEFIEKLPDTIEVIVKPSELEHRTGPLGSRQDWDSDD